MNQIADQAKARGMTEDARMKRRDSGTLSRPSGFVEYDELGGLLLYLASDAGASMNGAIILVDGRWTDAYVAESGLGGFGRLGPDSASSTDGRRPGPVLPATVRASARAWPAHSTEPRASRPSPTEIKQDHRPRRAAAKGQHRGGDGEGQEGQCALQAASLSAPKAGRAAAITGIASAVGHAQARTGRRPVPSESREWLADMQSFAAA